MNDNKSNQAFCRSDLAASSSNTETLPSETKPFKEEQQYLVERIINRIVNLGITPQMSIIKQFCADEQRFLYLSPMHPQRSQLLSIYTFFYKICFIFNDPSYILKAKLALAALQGIKHETIPAPDFKEISTSTPEIFKEQLISTHTLAVSIYIEEEKELLVKFNAADKVLAKEKNNFSQYINWLGLELRFVIINAQKKYANSCQGQKYRHDFDKLCIFQQRVISALRLIKEPIDYAPFEIIHDAVNYSAGAFTNFIMLAEGTKEELEKAKIFLSQLIVASKKLIDLSRFNPQKILRLLDLYLKSNLDNSVEREKLNFYQNSLSKIKKHNFDIQWAKGQSLKSLQTTIAIKSDEIGLITYIEILSSQLNNGKTNCLVDQQAFINRSLTYFRQVASFITNNGIYGIGDVFLSKFYEFIKKYFRTTIENNSLINAHIEQLESYQREGKNNLSLLEELLICLSQSLEENVNTKVVNSATSSTGKKLAMSGKSNAKAVAKRNATKRSPLVPDIKKQESVIEEMEKPSTKAKSAPASSTALTKKQKKRRDRREKKRDTFVSAIEAEITEVEAEIIAIETESTLVAADVAAVEADIAAVEADIAAVEADIAAVEADVAAVEADIAAVEADIAAVEADVAAVEADIAVVEADVAVVEADVAVVEADVATVEADVTVVEADIAAVEAERIAIEAESIAAEAEVTLSLPNEVYISSSEEQTQNESSLKENKTESHPSSSGSGRSSVHSQGLFRPKERVYRSLSSEITKDSKNSSATDFFGFFPQQAGSTKQALELFSSQLRTKINELNCLHQILGANELQSYELGRAIALQEQSSQSISTILLQNLGAEDRAIYQSVEVDKMRGLQLYKQLFYEILPIKQASLLKQFYQKYTELNHWLKKQLNSQIGLPVITRWQEGFTSEAALNYFEYLYSRMLPCSGPEEHLERDLQQLGYMETNLRSIEYNPELILSALAIKANRSLYFSETLRKTLIQNAPHIMQQMMLTNKDWIMNMIWKGFKEGDALGFYRLLQEYGLFPIFFPALTEKLFYSENRVVVQETIEQQLTMFSALPSEQRSREFLLDYFLGANDNASSYLTSTPRN